MDEPCRCASVLAAEPWYHLGVVAPQNHLVCPAGSYCAKNFGRRSVLITWPSYVSVVVEVGMFSSSLDQPP